MPNKESERNKSKNKEQIMWPSSKRGVSQKSNKSIEKPVESVNSSELMALKE